MNHGEDVEYPLLNATIAGLKMIDKAIADTLAAPIVPPRKPQADDIRAAKYLAHGGIHCPACLSEDIVGDSFNVEEGYCTQEMSCNACDATWTDEYELTGITDLKVGVKSTDGGQTIDT